MLHLHLTPCTCSGYVLSVDAVSRHIGMFLLCCYSCCMLMFTISIYFHVLLCWWVCTYSFHFSLFSVDLVCVPKFNPVLCLFCVCPQCLNLVWCLSSACSHNSLSQLVWCWSSSIPSVYSHWHRLSYFNFILSDVGGAVIWNWTTVTEESTTWAYSSLLWYRQMWWQALHLHGIHARGKPAPNTTRECVLFCTTLDLIVAS